MMPGVSVDAFTLPTRPTATGIHTYIYIMFYITIMGCIEVK